MKELAYKFLDSVTANQPFSCSRPEHKPREVDGTPISGLETADSHSLLPGRNISHMKELVHQFLDFGTADQPFSCSRPEHKPHEGASPEISGLWIS